MLFTEVQAGLQQGARNGSSGDEWPWEAMAGPRPEGPEGVGAARGGEFGGSGWELALSRCAMRPL